MTFYPKYFTRNNLKLKIDKIIECTFRMNSRRNKIVQHAEILIIINVFSYKTRLSLSKLFTDTKFMIRFYYFLE